MDDQRRIDQLEQVSAVVQDRQTRYEASQQLILAKLDSIGRDMSATRELLVTSLAGYVTHVAHQQRNTEVDARFNRNEAKLDAWIKWVVGALFGAAMAFLVEIFRLITHV